MDHTLSEHPQRLLLYSEVHARPPETIEAPARLSYLVLLGDADLEPLRALCARYGVDQPALDASHFSADMGPFRVRFERHTEFSRYLFAISGLSENPFEKNAIDSVPKDWLDSLEGELMVAIHVAVEEENSLPAEEEAISRKYFSGNALVGSRFSGRQGQGADGPAHSRRQFQPPAGSRTVAPIQGRWAALCSVCWRLTPIEFWRCWHFRLPAG